MDFRLIAVFFVIALLWLPAVASAQHGDMSDDVRFEDELSSSEFMITGRVRAIAVPSFILGFFFDEHSSNWSDGQKNFSYGAEFVWRRGSDFELGLAVDHADLSMPEAFWKESGDSPQSADWTEMDLQVWSVVFSAYWFWDVETWFTPFIGGGLGPGIVINNVERYDPEPGSACYSGLGGSGDATFAPPECFREDGSPDEDSIDFENPTSEDDIPPVVPMVNLTAGLRFNIQNYGVLKIETGIYPYLFAGVGFGGQW